MIKNLLKSAFILFLFQNCTQNTEYIRRISAERLKLNDEFQNAESSPLDSIDRINFKGLQFFRINSDYNVEARFEKFKTMPVFELAHSHNRTKPYTTYGKVSFVLEGNKFELLVFEPQNKKPGHENYLLLPFTDLTNGKETFTGGRYIDLEKTNNDVIEIDFNLAYTPYCAYSSHYTCPIPPKENFLNTEINAGQKYTYLK
jgi:uncharacterized protein (DUF1684 family)